MDLDNAELLALRIPVIQCFADNTCGGSHGDDDVLGIRCAEIIEQLVVGAGDLIDLGHVLFDDSRDCQIVLVGRLTCLEEDVRALRRTA